MSADSIDRQHPQGKQDSMTQLRNMKNVLKIGNKTLKHLRRSLEPTWP